MKYSALFVASDIADYVCQQLPPPIPTEQICKALGDKYPHWLVVTVLGAMIDDWRVLRYSKDGTIGAGNRCRAFLLGEWQPDNGHVVSPSTPRKRLQRAASSGLDAPDYLELVIAALLNHHQPDEAWRSCCWQPMKQTDLLAQLKLTDKQKGRISEAVKQLFGSQKRYAQLCRRQSDDLLKILRRASGETAAATGAADRIDGISGSNQMLADLLIDRSS